MTSNRREPFFILSVVLCAFLLLAAYAHIAKAQSRVQTRIVSNVELVQVPIIVFDAKGAIPTDLKKSDFRIWEDGVEQHTVRLDRERVAVSFIVVADVSGSMTKKIPFVQEAALSLLDPLEPVDKRWDEYSVLSVGRRSKLLLSFTHDQAEVQKEMPQLLNATDESTALFDGVWLGVSTAEERARNKHRAMVVITDGGDNHSRYKLGETKRLLEEADMPVFAVMAGPSFRVPSLRSGQGFPDQFPSEQSSQRGMPRLPIPTSAQDYIGPAERRGPHNMKVLTEASGGGVFTAKREDDLTRIVRTIGLAVRYRYVLSYEPPSDEGARAKRASMTTNHFHDVRLELYPKQKFARYSIPYYKRRYFRAQ